jgi:PAS domain S-box-containing protein
MKQTKKESGKIGGKKNKKGNKLKLKLNKAKLKKLTVENNDDNLKLVHLLQVHQIELEHQNQELRIAQEELEVSRSKYVNLFDFSPVPYFTLNPDGVINELNLSAAKMFGADRKKIIGNLFIAYIVLEDRGIFNAFIKDVFNVSVKHSCEIKVINKAKRIFHVLMEGLELDSAIEPDKKCQVALIDLTGYKNVENSLKESTIELKLLNATKDKFFSIIAHDLRSPFQTLLGFSELLASQIETLTKEEIISFSNGLNNNLLNVYGLLDNLLHWSLMQRGIVEYKPGNLNLYEIVNKMIGISNPVAKKKNISISNNVDTGIVVYADTDMILSIIQNLITNAIKFTPAEGSISISSIEKGSCVEVSVQDTGVGIKTENISDLFNFNSIITTNGTSGEKGTGLGLPLCKEFVEKHGGKIWAVSEVGKGSKFTFTLLKSIS